MYFKLDLTIRNVYLDKDTIEIDYDGTHNVPITLRIPTEEEQAVGHEKRNPFCIVEGQWEPNNNIVASFQSLADMKMPKGSKKTDEWHIYNIELDGTIKVKMYVPLRLLPDSMVSFIDQVNGELMDYAKRTVNVLRWRCGTEGEHNPISSRPASWSFDGQNWLPLPSGGKAYMWTGPYIRTTEEILEDAKAYVNVGKNYPLGHELYLEAWEQRHQNPRSALIVGIAAAETGLKQCINTFVPDAKWLIENTTSPDLVKMLFEYLPLLPTTNRVNKKVFASKTVLNEMLKKGVFMRNQLVHGRATKITYETLEEILLAVHDVLWILDYCSGYKWPLEYVRPDIRKILEETDS
jgi:hypothetical protein